MVHTIGIPGSLEFLLGLVGELDYGDDINRAFGGECLKFHRARALSDETKIIAEELAHQAAKNAPSDENLWTYRKGFLAELEVIDELEGVVAHEYLLFNNVHLYPQGKLCQLDHVLVGPSGVDLIDAKSWSEEYYTKELEKKAYDQMHFEADTLWEYLGVPFNTLLYDAERRFESPPDDIKLIYPGELKDLITGDRGMEQTMKRVKEDCARKVKLYEHKGLVLQACRKI